MACFENIAPRRMCAAGQLQPAASADLWPTFASGLYFQTKPSTCGLIPIVHSIYSDYYTVYFQYTFAFPNSFQYISAVYSRPTWCGFSPPSCPPRCQLPTWLRHELASCETADRNDGNDADVTTDDESSPLLRASRHKIRANAPLERGTTAPTRVVFFRIHRARFSFAALGQQ